MRKKFKILIDMDGIVVDLLPDWLALYNEDWDDELGPENITSWDTHKHVKPECGGKVYELLNEPLFFRWLRPVDGAIEGVLKLKAQGHEIKFATASPCPGACTDKADWIEEHFPGVFSHRDVIFAHEKVTWLDADILIDDRPDTIIEWANSGRTAATIAHPYNLCAALHAKIYAQDIFRPLVAWNTLVHSIKLLSDGANWHRMGRAGIR